MRYFSTCAGICEAVSPYFHPSKSPTADVSVTAAGRGGAMVACGS
jgi:hypothetical protein